MSKPFRHQAFGLSIDVKKFFFDRKLVQDRVGAQTAKALGKIGGSIRLIARRSMRFNKGGKPSPPGTPPRYHTKDENATLRKILFALEPDGLSVVVGPVKLNGSKGRVPALHEFGGSQKVREKLVTIPRKRGQPAHRAWVPLGKRQARPGQPVRSRLATYPKRPFMQPALLKYLPKIPQEFEGMVRSV